MTFYLFMDRGYTIRVEFTITHSLCNQNFLFEKYSSWDKTGYCIFPILQFPFGKYSSWERIGTNHLEEKRSTVPGRE
jgi:hypothetical protein